MLTIVFSIPREAVGHTWYVAEPPSLMDRSVFVNFKLGNVTPPGRLTSEGATPPLLFTLIKGRGNVLWLSLTILTSEVLGLMTALVVFLSRMLKYSLGSKSVSLNMGTEMV